MRCLGPDVRIGVACLVIAGFVLGIVSHAYAEEEKQPGDVAPPSKPAPKEAKHPPKEDIYGVDKETQAAIDRAIEAGKAYLIRHQQRGKRGKAAEYNGSFPKLMDDGLAPPLHSFILYSLAACGVDPEDEVFTLGMGCKPLYGRFQGSKFLNYGYAVHVLFQVAWIKACEAKYKDAPRIPRALRRRIRQCKASIRDIIKTFEKNRSTHVWRYPGPWQGSIATEDLSATQYVMLAIKAAARVGAIKPKKACALCTPALVYLLESQEASGPKVQLTYFNSRKESRRYGEVIKGRTVEARGWSYIRKEQAKGDHDTKITGSMTAAGVACLAIAKELWVLAKNVKPNAPEVRAKKVVETYTLADIDNAILCGWAKLGEMFTVSSNPGNASWHYYWLYGVERTGALLGVPNMGEHRWYRDGAKYLLSKQHVTNDDDKGRWPGADRSGPGAERTCYALLFLKRATQKPLAPLLPPVTTE